MEQPVNEQITDGPVLKDQNYRYKKSVIMNLAAGQSNRFA